MYMLIPVIYLYLVDIFELDLPVDIRDLSLPVEEMVKIPKGDIGELDLPGAPQSPPILHLLKLEQHASHTIISSVCLLPITGATAVKPPQTYGKHYTRFAKFNYTSVQAQNTYCFYNYDSYRLPDLEMSLTADVTVR
jgi:hypothetical protein